jgi:hypothetical protein
MDRSIACRRLVPVDGGGGKQISSHLGDPDLMVHLEAKKCYSILKLHEFGDAGVYYGQG